MRSSEVVGEPIIPAVQSFGLRQEVAGKIVAQVSSYVISILYIANVLVR